MQKISLPPLRSGIQITVPAREPPQRSWSRYKKVLIDNPKDSNLLQRQKLWNFQKLNRGAFRSQISALPDIPYRVQNAVDKVSVGVQADLSQSCSQGLRVIFPNLAARRARAFPILSDDDDSEDDDVDLTSDQRHKACSPMHAHDETNGEYSDDFEETSSIDDPGFEFDTVVRKQNAGTMTDTKRKSDKRPKRKERRKKSLKERNASLSKDKSSIIKSNAQKLRTRSLSEKNVKVEQDSKWEPIETIPTLPALVKEQPLLPEVENVSADEEDIDIHAIQRIDITSIGKDRPPSRESSASSNDSRGDFLNIPLEHMGHSSHLSLDNLSILDLLSGSRTDRSRTTNQQKVLTSRDEINTRKYISDPDADRVWFEQIVGDKEVIDRGTYENFARTRPNPPPESQSDSNNDKYNDFARNSSRKSMPTPRVNDEFPAYRQVISYKNSQTKSSVNNTTSVSRKNIRRGMISIGKFY